MQRSAHYLGALLAGYFAVMAVLPVWYGWIAPPRLIAPAWAIALLALPLFTALRGLLHGHVHTVKWSLFLSLLYFTHGIVEAWTEPTGRICAFVEITGALLWLVAGVLYVRVQRGAAAG